MPIAQQKEYPLTATEVLEILPSFPEGIARELDPLLQAADIGVYKHFLLCMYHYTHDAEQQLKFARDKCTDPILKEYFDEMAREERGHYRMAAKDYEAFGESVANTKAPESVQSFKNYWYALGKDNVNEFVGAMYVFENVASRAAKEVIAMMARLELPKSQTTWLRVHLEADVGHGDEAFEMCQKYAADNPSAMLSAAQKGAKEWFAVFKYAFSRSCDSNIG